MISLNAAGEALTGEAIKDSLHNMKLQSPLLNRLTKQINTGYS